MIFGIKFERKTIKCNVNFFIFVKYSIDSLRHPFSVHTLVEEYFQSQLADPDQTSGCQGNVKLP